MKRICKLLILSFLLVLGINSSNAQGLLFAQRAGSDSQGSDGDEGNSIVVDDDGNIYVTGTMLSGSSGAVFGKEQTNETSLSINGAFVAKYDNKGELIWVEQAGSSNNSITGYAIDIDNDNNVYISGTFYQEATFGLGQTNETHLAGTSNDIFLAKYDTNGQLLWAKSSGGESDDNPGGKALVVDKSGNIYMTGGFGGTAIFGHGEPNETTLVGEELDIFLAKYDTNGMLVWIRQAGGSHSDLGKNLDIDELGNIYITGNYFDSATFGQGQSEEITLSGINETAFMAKYSNDGDFIWAIEPFSSVSADCSGDIKIDITGNILFTGSFGGTITLGKGSSNEEQFTGTALDHIIIAKYSFEGDYIWGKTAQSNGGDRGVSVATDTKANVFVTGYYGGDIQFGANERNDTTITNSGLGDIFLAKFSPEGEFIWVTSAGGNGWEQGTDVSVDKLGNCYLTGFYGGNSIFGKDESNETTLNLSGKHDIYISKFQLSFNANPEFEIDGELTLKEDFLESNNLAITPINTPSNEENQVVSYTVEPQVSDVLDFSFDKSSGTLSLTSIENVFGEQVFVITADDGQKENYSFVNEFTITVEPVNDVPIISGTVQELITPQETPIEIYLTDLVVTDADNNFPDDFTLVVADGDNYTINKNVIMPDKDFFGELNVPVSVNDGNLESEGFTVPICVSEVVGIEDDFVDKNFAIYPNPVNNRLHINLNNSIESCLINIYNIKGTLIYSMKSSSMDKNQRIDFSSFSKGIYLLEFISNDRKYLKKILKN